MLVAGAAALLYVTGSQAEQDVASLTASDLINGTEGDFFDMVSSGQAAGDPNQNRQAFLYAIKMSEVGAALTSETDNGYNVLVGATPANPLTFSDYSTHPNVYNAALNSTAAGAYQINHPTWLTLVNQTGLSDFSPSTQDAMALQLIANKGALADIDAGNLNAAMVKLQPVWRSLPGAVGGVSGQRNNSASQWIAWYQGAGGTLA
ncbi:MAG: glycoside hydrolase family 104 protein [Burkholderia sp.]|uniref:glycoside hydrolase family 24 protein n=1 Tax=Burkholderia sp. TaxID=36773 RepID=UPI002590EA97|nr:glycoside hydrolase family 104 protein [Burkholderia sp.]MCA3780143.1 glycoside hydrolase family 104 protein [Burkholderia sp.]MCA3788490.1 glycoside hydrolase family 104 protein [Burkholderia sp.]MCA3804028.1 glycoside hydrolase family 104 protein [Burkholderia sp.]MCA3812269.1 glycoside hydrolase family 104 protein [Burkholderia sp.]MCA3818916.1 glycoside hydrolase family 104 protein [Burkholderia sp.]